MNLRYLGDALDHWKGSLFEYLQDAELLKDLAVDAMASNARKWHVTDWRLFATLLRVEEAQVIPHNQLLAVERIGYFMEVTHRTDLFLDPDTGIATGKVRDAARYLFAAEAHDILSQEPERVVAVYQHIRAQRSRDRLNRVIAFLRRPDRPFSSCSYESGTVAMLFLSRSARRVDSVHHGFERLLGQHAKQRIHRW